MLTKRPSHPARLCRRICFATTGKELFTMSDKALYWGSVTFGALALLLLVANVCLINGNHNMQIELNQRQAAINNSGNMSQLNQALVQALAQAAVDNDDKDIRDLLAAQGISIKPKADKAADKKAGG
jgi:hypothetical protein